ncbi:MAG: pyridoxal-phosphate dependent enzyme, partial [Ilumatobacteraceae bacterium]
MTSTMTAAEDSHALASQLGLADTVVDEGALAESIRKCAANNVVLPTFAQLANPSLIPTDIASGVDKNSPDSRNLFRVHWFNDMAGNRVSVPDHVVLPKSLTGVDSPIVVMFGDRFPMITAHKVLAAYSCLAPRVITGQFNPTTQRAVWPSTGNYARGGVAISKIMGARGVAVLPAGMSQERFDWLDRWTSDPSDIIRTPGTESNVKEIYDACNEMQKDPKNFIFNQFCEFGNYLGHYEVTGRALSTVYEYVAKNLNRPNLRLAAFTSATGSAGTIGAGDHLKDKYGTKIVAVEALECPTMLENGFGEHNIQGIGDKHIPLIHNVMNTDVIAAVSDRVTDELDVLFNTPAGRDYLVQRKHIPQEIVDTLPHFGFSAICNTIAAIKTAKLLGLGADDVLITIATDGADLYPSERVKTLKKRFNDDFTQVDAAEVFAEHLA